MNDPKSILITGASSGIGEALALEYAAPGVSLALTGRDQVRLDAVAQKCRDAGAKVHASTVPVTDAEAMAQFIRDADSAQPLDLVIANAGISAGSGEGDLGETQAQARAIFDVNFTGVFNTIWPAIEAMQARKRGPTKGQTKGQIAITSSMAGITPMPGAPAYSASKVAVKAYAEALHGALKPQGIIVSAICPGFVRSRITDQNDFPMPGFMEASKAATIIRKGLAKGRISIIFPWRVAVAVWFLSILPPCWRVWLLSRAPKKS